MKKREDFVSNSSSSSFVVITDTGREFVPKFQPEPVGVPSSELGQHEFGWQTEKYDDFWSKLNWCAIMVRDKIGQEEYDEPDDILKEEVAKPWFRAEKMQALLEEVCASLGLNAVVDVNDDPDDWDRAYIDHQSGVGEKPANARMFQSAKALRDFLVNEGSYIDCSNDNGGRDDDEYDWDARRYSSQPPDYYDAKAKAAE